MEVDPDAIDKLRVVRSDFMHALQYDIKPVSTRTNTYIFIFRIQSAEVLSISEYVFSVKTPI